MSNNTKYTSNYIITTANKHHPLFENKVWNDKEIITSQWSLIRQITIDKEIVDDQDEYKKFHPLNHGNDKDRVMSSQLQYSNDDNTNLINSMIADNQIVNRANWWW